MSKVQDNNHQISGRVVFVGMPEVISEKFSKRIIVLETFVGSRNYEKETVYEFANNNMSALDGINKGDWVSIDFQCGGRGYVKNGVKQWFATLEGTGCVLDRD